MIPEQPKNSYRVKLELSLPESRLDSVLMKAFRAAGDNPSLMNLSRAKFKQLFKEKKIVIKGQPANAASGLAAGTTYIDILGYEAGSTAVEE